MQTPSSERLVLSHNEEDPPDVSVELMLRDGLVPVCLALSAVLIAWTVIHTLRTPSGFSDLYGAMAGLSAMILLCVAILLKQVTLAEGWSHHVAGGIACLLLGNCIAPVALEPSLSDSCDLLLLIVGCGCIMVSLRWLIAIVTLAAGAWFLLTWNLLPVSDWSNTRFSVLTAVVVAFVIYAARMRVYSRLLILQKQSKQRLNQSEAANRAKSEFLANMSHEIRTPMTAILGFSDLLGDNVIKPENIEAVNAIKRNGGYLLELINDILDLSKIESRKLCVESIPCSPSSILNEVTSLMRVRADAKGISLETSYDSPVPETIRTDPVRLRQILINLISNAIKFTNEGSVRILARLAESADGQPCLQFEVIDTGIGISEAQMDRLFRPFTQADASTTRNFGGTGLGLTICKRLSEILGGDIRAKSTLGTGSSFTLTTATGPLAGVPLINVPAEEIRSEGACCHLNPMFSARPLSCRVLVVEDGVDNQRLVSFLLQKAGAEVSVAENGRIAVDRVLGLGCEPEIFDVILMDMQMPVLDGYAATRELRDNGYPGPIIALTAHAMKHDRQKCLDAGCDHYLMKPINRDKMIESIYEFSRTAHRTVTAS